MIYCRSFGTVLKYFADKLITWHFLLLSSSFPLSCFSYNILAGRSHGNMSHWIQHVNCYNYITFAALLIHFNILIVGKAFIKSESFDNKLCPVLPPFFLDLFCHRLPTLYRSVLLLTWCLKKVSESRKRQSSDQLLHQFFYINLSSAVVV